jgi:hypothetical protein
MKRDLGKTHAGPGRFVGAVLGLALLAAGCVPAVTGAVYGLSDHGPTKEQKQLIKEELAPYRSRGESAISGKVFLETPGGVVTGAGRSVHLTPATTYMKALVERDVIGKNKMIDRRADDVWWTTRADKEGRFTFSWLPAGEYFVLCPIAWSPSGGTSVKTGVAYAMAKVGSREHVVGDVKRVVK